ILQLAGKCSAVVGACAMHLPKRSGGGGMMLEMGETLLPVGAKLGRHAALDEGPTHRGRLALQLHQLGGIFRRQRVGDRGHELGPFSPPSATASSIAFLPRSSVMPNSRAPARRAATPLILAPTRA